MNRVVISSLESAVALMQANPQLQTLPALQSLRPLLQRNLHSEGCCGAKPDLSTYRTAFEGAFRNMTAGQRQDMKRILGVDEVAFFVRTGTQIAQQTF
jgi:hypothetical protein